VPLRVDSIGLVVYIDAGDLLRCCKLSTIVICESTKHAERERPEHPPPPSMTPPTSSRMNRFETFWAFSVVVVSSVGIHSGRIRGPTHGLSPGIPLVSFIACHFDRVICYNRFRVVFIFFGGHVPVVSFWLCLFFLVAC